MTFSAEQKMQLLFALRSKGVTDTAVLEVIEGSRFNGFSLDEKRRFFVTFGLDAMAEKRRFMIRVALGLTLAMALTAFTPLGPLLIAEGIGAEAEVTRRALAALQVMTLLPLLIILRNLFHGILMVEERTGGMALGSILRVLTIAGLAQLLAPVGLLTPSTAAWTLLAGFATETAVVAYRVLRLRALAP